MPRARISTNGIEIAKAGKDVDTAPLEDLVFSSQFVSLRLAKTGVVTPTTYAGFLSSRYNRSIVYYDTPFSTPPLVLVAGIRPNGTSDQSQHYTTAIPLSSGNPSYLLPYYSVESYTDRFELYVHAREASGDPRPFYTSDWRYFVFSYTIA